MEVDAAHFSARSGFFAPPLLRDGLSGYNSPTMEPRVQYARTEAGVSIAYWAMGEGPPLVVMPNIPMSHVELEWRIPEYRAWYESMLGFSRVVRYDNRGSGLSDRDASDFSLEGHLRDLGAVADQLGDQPMALNAPLLVGPVAIAYAA